MGLSRPLGKRRRSRRLNLKPKREPHSVAVGYLNLLTHNNLINNLHDAYEMDDVLSLYGIDLEDYPSIHITPQGMSAQRRILGSAAVLLGPQARIDPVADRLDEDYENANRQF